MMFVFTIMLFKKNGWQYLEVNSKIILKNYEKFQKMIEESSK